MFVFHVTPEGERERETPRAREREIKEAKIN